MTRLFDIVLSLIAIIILLPFMIPIMIGLKCTGEHDIFYYQERIGKEGKPFKLMKFATMLRNSPNLPGGLYTSKNDPRLLPMGKFLRKTKINELPQLINILKGDMSIIGYRPTVAEHFEGYPGWVKEKLAKVAPGLSGIGSIVFRNEEEILQSVEEKVDRGCVDGKKGTDIKKQFHQLVIAPYKGALEAWYADNRSLVLYFQLIIMTIIAVLKPNYEGWKTAFRRYPADFPPVPKDLEPYL